MADARENRELSIETMNKITVKDISERKNSKEKITALSTYDFPFAKLADESGADVVLVGDSVGMVSLGYSSTLPVTMREMIHHTKAVSKAVKRALIVGDMPFGSYQDSEDRTVRNAKRFLKEAGADAVKLEGGEKVLRQVEAIIRAGIPLMGHLGMTPQSASELGGYKVQGKTEKSAGQMEKEAILLERAGVFSIVLECVPLELAKKITEKVKIPTIGIGAGPHVDGQILVLHDLLGFESGVHPRFVRRYANLDKTIREAIASFREDVSRGNFPSQKESFE